MRELRVSDCEKFKLSLFFGYLENMPVEKLLNGLRIP